MLAAAAFYLANAVQTKAASWDYRDRFLNDRPRTASRDRAKILEIQMIG
jgi:hypothetical protein